MNDWEEWGMPGETMRVWRKEEERVDVGKAASDESLAIDIDKPASSLSL